MTEERVLSLRELNRALLERQLLLQRRRLSIPRAVERLCALQAQYSLSPYIALWSRINGFRREQLTRALEERRVVKASLFRITLHMASARDYPYFAAAFLPAAQEMTPRATAATIAELSRAVNAAATRHRSPTSNSRQSHRNGSAAFAGAHGRSRRWCICRRAARGASTAGHSCSRCRSGWVWSCRGGKRVRSIWCGAISPPSGPRRRTIWSASLA